VSSDVIRLVHEKVVALKMASCEKHAHTHTHTHTFNGPFSGTNQVSHYQKGKINLDFTEARHSEWQWHQLGRMEVCTLLQTENHASTPPLCFLQAGCPSCCPVVKKWCIYCCLARSAHARFLWLGFLAMFGLAGTVSTVARP